jgi:hypothetical protein
MVTVLTEKRKYRGFQLFCKAVLEGEVRSKILEGFSLDLKKVF